MRTPKERIENSVQKIIVILQEMKNIPYQLTKEESEKIQCAIYDHTTGTLTTLRSVVPRNDFKLTDN